MNKVARLPGSLFAFGAGVLFAAAIIGIGIEFKWRSAMFHMAPALMIPATIVRLFFVLWSRKDRARRLTREVDRFAWMWRVRHLQGLPWRGLAS